MKPFVCRFLAGALLATALLLNATDSHALAPGGGVAVGNGGGVIVCRNSDRSIKSIEVLDLFEARVLRNIRTDLDQFPGDWEAKAKAAIARLGQRSLLRNELYGRWLYEFYDRSKTLSNENINTIPDSLHVGVPVGCAYEQAAVQIVPRFPGDPRYYLNGELWNAMSEVQRAALALHEIVYREALSYGHTDSTATRYFVAMIASPALLAMNTAYFPDVLRNIHFELADFPLPDSRMTSTFDPIALWRLGTDGEMPPYAIQLRGRVVVNIGVCANAGCTEWNNLGTDNGKNPFTGEVFHGINYAICSGTRSIDFGDGQNRVDFHYGNLFDASFGHRCAFHFTINSVDGPYQVPAITSVRFSADPDRTRIDLRLPGRNFPGVDFPAVVPVLLKNGSPGRAPPANFSRDLEYDRKTTNFHLYAVNSRKYYDPSQGGVEISIDDSAPRVCNALIILDDTGSRISLVDAMTSTDPDCPYPKINFQISSRVYTWSPLRNVDWIKMDRPWRPLPGDRFTEIEGTMLTGIRCAEAGDPCLTISNAVEGTDRYGATFNPRAIDAAGPIQLPSTRIPDCLLSPGHYDLIPNTNLPARFTLAQDCTVDNRQGGKIVFTAHRPYTWKPLAPASWDPGFPIEAVTAP